MFINHKAISVLKQIPFMYIFYNNINGKKMCSSDNELMVTITNLLSSNNEDDAKSVGRESYELF